MVEDNKAITWNDRMIEMCGCRGKVLQDDSDGTSQVSFPPPIGFTAWVPTSALTTESDVEMHSGEVLVSVGAEQLRSEMEANPSLEWEDRLQDICGEVGTVVKEDESVGTSGVKFSAPLDTLFPEPVWLPSSSLTVVTGSPKRQRVA